MQFETDQLIKWLLWGFLAITLAIIMIAINHIL
jgi:hypothetical protein